MRCPNAQAANGNARSSDSELGGATLEHLRQRPQGVGPLSTGHFSAEIIVQPDLPDPKLPTSQEQTPICLHPLANALARQISPRWHPVLMQD